MTGLMRRTSRCSMKPSLSIAFVGEEGCGFDFLGQDLGLRCVVNVSAGEAHRQRIAQRIDDGVNLGRRSSARAADRFVRSEEHTSELQSRQYLVCRLLLEKKKLIEE